MFTKFNQLSFAAIYDQCSDWVQDDKPKFLEMLEKHLNLKDLIPLSFYQAYYNHLGRDRVYSLESIICALLLQRILGIPKVSLLLVILKLSKDIRKYCGFKTVPDQSQITRFKQNFESYLEDFFHHLVDITEPLCQKLNQKLADCLIFDTSGIEAYVTENNPKYLNSIIRRMKRYYKNNPEVDPYNMAYGSMPSSASSNDEIKQLYINGHFCYVYKFAIMTNAMGIVRHISFLDDGFKNDHPELNINKKSDSPDEDKSIGDSTALNPVLKDFFEFHPDFSFNTFIGDSAFDSYEIYPFLLKNCNFEQAVIPLNGRNSKSLPEPGYNESGWPLCPKDDSLPMKPNGICREKGRSTRFKWVCSETHFENGKRVCHCEDPCTDSKYGRVVYTYPDQDLRTFPGLPRDTEEWTDLYNLRGCVEQTINFFKEPMGIGNPKTQNKKTIKADLFLAGITQLITLILADRINKPEYMRSLKPLVA